MSEPKADYLTAQFLEAASRAKHVEHNLFCPTCSETTDHDLHIRGDLEVYVCPVCGNSQTFRTK
jgi:predicted RNA-binding Zn-ribbon protein involved in translation (DUF1610 family)